MKSKYMFFTHFFHKKSSITQPNQKTTLHMYFKIYQPSFNLPKILITKSMLPCCGATKLFHLSCKHNNHYLHFKLFVKFFLQLFFNRVRFQMILLFNCLKLIVVEITDFLSHQGEHSLN